MNSYLLSGLLSFLLTTSLHASSRDNLFLKYTNNYFIETGSYSGDGIQRAIDANFKTIYSIELSPMHYLKCLERFQTYPNINMVFGDSTQMLPIILKDINEPITFWLDGHNSWGGTARGATNSPILAELNAIKEHPIKTHTILIDDVRQFNTIHFDFIELQDIIDILLQINPNYQFKYEDGCIPNDILVAYIPQ